MADDILERPRHRCTAKEMMLTNEKISAKAAPARAVVTALFSADGRLVTVHRFINFKYGTRSVGSREMGRRGPKAGGKLGCELAKTRNPGLSVHNISSSLTGPARRPGVGWDTPNPQAELSRDPIG